MRLFKATPAAISSFVLLTLPRLVAATPLALNESEPGIEKRCANSCGYYGQLCCASSQTCSTNSAGQAVCLDGGNGGGDSNGGGGWQYYTTTYVTTEVDVATITSIWSSQIVAPTHTGSCEESLGETPCGSDCCDATSVCVNNQCVIGSSSAAAFPTATATGGENPATPPVRGTSNGMATVTETAAPTTTQGFLAPVGTDGSSMIGVKAPSEGGLSGGAIAGIVIGVIAGVFLLFLICACMCCRGVIDGLLALFGLGGRRRRETTTYVDRYSHHSHGGRPEGRTWFGTRPPRPEGHEHRSKWSIWATIGIILGALALCLGLKRRRDHDDEKSDTTYPSSYYYYSDYYSSPSTYPLSIGYIR